MKEINYDYSEFSGITLTVNEAKDLTVNYSTDDVQALIRAGEVPGCLYVKKEGCGRGKFIISKPHWLAFINGRTFKEKRKTSATTVQSITDV